MKKCIKCGELKSLKEFYKRTESPDGRRQNCKVCHEKRRADLLSDPDRKQKNIEWHRNSCRIYMANLRSKIKDTDEYKAKKKEADKKSYQKHSISRRAKNKLYYLKNKDKIRITTRKWANNNKGRIKGYLSRRVGKSKISKREWTYLCAYYDNKCLCCGKQIPLTVDHVIPISKDGSGELINIQPLCLSCNSSKNAKTIDYRNKVTEQDGVVVLNNNCMISGLIIDMMKVGIPKLAIKNESTYCYIEMQDVKYIDFNSILS